MLGVRLLDVDFMRIYLACALLLYKLYAFLEQSNQPRLASRCPSTHAGPVGRVGGKLATIEIIQFPCETPGGGDFWIFQKMVWPLLQKFAQEPFSKLSS